MTDSNSHAATQLSTSAHLATPELAALAVCAAYANSAIGILNCGKLVKDAMDAFPAESVARTEFLKGLQRGRFIDSDENIRRSSLSKWCKIGSKADLHRPNAEKGLLPPSHNVIYELSTLSDEITPEQLHEYVKSNSCRLTTEGVREYKHALRKQLAEKEHRLGDSLKATLDQPTSSAQPCGLMLLTPTAQVLRILQENYSDPSALHHYFSSIVAENAIAVSVCPLSAVTAVETRFFAACGFNRPTFYQLKRASKPNVTDRPFVLVSSRGKRSPLELDHLWDLLADEVTPINLAEQCAPLVRPRLHIFQSEPAEDWNSLSSVEVKEILCGHKLIGAP